MKRPGSRLPTGQITSIKSENCFLAISLDAIATTWIERLTMAV